ncbi:MAG: MFS transporter [Acidimicrobiales bacterium]|jgi:MFS family permease
MMATLASIEIDSARAWTIAFAAALTNGVAFGTVYTFGSFFKGMASSFDTGLGPTSIVFGITMFLFFGIGAISGYWCDRIGPRPLVIAGGTLFCLGLLATSQVNELWHGYFTYGVGLGLGGGLFTAPLFATVAGWFDTHRALAQGVTAAGNGLGTMILVPIAKSWINSYGWRTAFRLLAIVCAVSFAIGATLIARSPVPPSFDGKARLRAASKSPSFRIMGSSSFLMSMALIPAFAFIIPFAEENGVSSARAASIIMIVGGASVLGRIALTKLSAKLGSVRVAQACLLAQPVAYLIWLIGGSNYLALVGFAVLLGVAYGGYVALLGEVTATIYGVVGIGTVLGGLYFFSGLGSLIGPPTAGFLADHSSQTVAIAAVLAISLIGSLNFLRLRPDPIVLDLRDPDDFELDFRTSAPALQPEQKLRPIPART